MKPQRKRGSGGESVGLEQISSYHEFKCVMLWKAGQSLKYECPLRNSHKSSIQSYIIVLKRAFNSTVSMLLTLYNSQMCLQFYSVRLYVYFLILMADTYQNVRKSAVVFDDHLSYICVMTGMYLVGKSYSSAGLVSPKSYSS